MPEHIEHPPKRGAERPALPAMGVATSLARLRRATGASLAFCGSINAGGVRLDRFDGPVVGPLRGVQLDAGHGLGGRVAGHQRALSITDYVASPAITHRYDEIIRAESLRAMAAAPVVVAGRPLAVLYVALRTSQQQMGRLLDAVSREARALEHEIVAKDALDRVRATVAESHARLRTIAADVEDEELRSRLLETADLLADRPAPTASGPKLTGRERDVLALVSLGLSNRAIAEQLGIGVHTVKDHVGNLLAKLGARRRMEAVETARRLDLTP